MPNDENAQGFVRTRLPWIAAAAMLLVYLLTLNHWVNLRSLPAASKVAGWDPNLPVQWPVFYLLTYPFRFFPAGIQPLALNVFAAVCGALTLALLARSVALLPHDRTHEQRTRERSEFSLLSIPLAWVPVTLAVLVCGLQLTYWEHATALTGEMLSLAMFAYVIRCLLEYRITHHERWLSKMALVYGLAVTNDWAMIGFFPGFLVALVWIKGVRFFDAGFLIRMTLLGLFGLLMYLLLPIVWQIKGTAEASFWEVLRANWTGQKLFLVDTKVLRNRALLLALPSVLPVLLMGIRWPSSSGDTSAAGATMTNAAFRIIHLFFLAACLWVAFDPPYSPRHLGMGLSFLTFYYLAALAIGYYSGYALLVFTPAPRKGWKRDESVAKIVNPIVRVALLAAAIAVPAALAWKNWGAVQAGNGTLLREFATRTTKLLPPAPAYLLSEDPYQLALVEAVLDSTGPKNDYILINTRSLAAPAYHLQMRRRFGERWPLIIDPEIRPAEISEPEIQRLMRHIASSNQVVYLHPSFGYFFEDLYPEPEGQIYLLKTFAPDQVLPPPVSPADIQKNNAFWNEPENDLQKISRLRAQNSPDAKYLSSYYSRALDAWGVFLQRAGQLTPAEKYFRQAIALNTNNAAARLNDDFNQAVQAGKASEALDQARADELLGSYRSWDELLAENGPIDQPDLCQLLGNSFLSQSQFRQAALQFSRAIAFQPTNYLARSGFAKALIFGGWTERGLAELDQIKRDIPNLPEQNLAELAGVRAAAYYGQTNYARAEEILKEARAAYPEQSKLAESLVDLYRTTGRFTNAMAVLQEQIDRQPTNIVARLQKAELYLGQENFPEAHATLDTVLALAPENSAALLFHAFAYIQEKKFDQALLRIDRILKTEPENTQAHIYKGVALMEQGDFDKARESFDRALRKDPSNVAALRNRAILNLRAKRWAEARDDYEQLRKFAPKSHAVMYGLGEAAYNQKDFEAARNFYEAYLKYAPAGGGSDFEEEKKRVQARLAELNAAKK